MSKTIQETLEFIKQVKERLQQEYDVLHVNTRKVLQESSLSHYDRSHLEWGLAHMHTSLTEFLRDLDRHAVTLLQEIKKNGNQSRVLPKE